MNYLKICLIITTGFVTTNVYATSFNCDNASTFVENTICSDSEISDLDETMASSYRAALADADNTSEIKREQRNWLKKRNLCKDEVCLKTSYQQRISELSGSASSSVSSSSNGLPRRVGECVESSIVGKSTRFEGAVAGQAGGEVFVSLEHDVSLYIQSIANLPSTENTDEYMYSTNDFRVGDKVELCLQALPTDCPAGDDRGKVYSVTNYKNNMSFVGVDAWHLCGGA